MFKTSYINKEKTLEEVNRLKPAGVFSEAIKTAVIKIIEKQPDADAVEVKHGEWHLLYNCANEGVYCSACNKKVYKTDYANQKIKSPYCPNCGAKMDKKEGAEE